MLDRLVGEWATTMRHEHVAEPVAGRHRYERVLDGAFVRLTAAYEHPDFPDAQAFLWDTGYHYFDVRGVVRVFDFALDADGWTMTWLDPGMSQRAAYRLTGPDTIEATGEASDDTGTTWRPDWSMTLRRTG
jgi:hypothetical protein